MSSAANRFLSALAAASVLVSPMIFADEVQLASGDKVTGSIIEMNDDVIVLEHAVLGTLTIPRAEVASVIGPGEAADEPPPPPPVDDEKLWKSHVEFGGSAEFGNSDAQAFHATFVTTRENEDEKTTIDAGYFYGASDGDRTTNRATVGIVHNWFFTESKWFWFADGRYEFDEFQSWEHRLSAHTGPGYHLIEEEDFTLDLRAGLGAFREWGSENEDIQFEAQFGADLGWDITDDQRFELSTTIYPNLSDLGEYRWVTTANWRVMLDEEANMSLAAGLRNEYQSQVDPGVKHNDLSVFAGLQFDF